MNRPRPNNLPGMFASAAPQSHHFFPAARAKTPPPRTVYEEPQGVRASATFLAVRVARFLPRALFQILCLAAVVVFVGKLGVADHRFWGNTAGCAPSWEWTSIEFDDDASKKSGLRIVVFGQNDIASPLPALGDNGTESAGKSWTESLCDELQCATYLSFVPQTPTSLSTAHHSPWLVQPLTSHPLYRTTLTTLERSLAATRLSYSHLTSAFPLARQRLPDLAAQVDTFLTMAQEEVAPAAGKTKKPAFWAGGRTPKRQGDNDAASAKQQHGQETLYVFALGTWDVWALAGLPRTLASGVLSETANTVWSQAERLFQADLARAELRAKEGRGGGRNESAEADVEGVLQGGRAEEAPILAFRVLVPALFDPSLTPGWTRHRPRPPRPHSRAEELRNAAWLAERWNRKMWQGMAGWVGRSNDDGKEDASPGTVVSMVAPPLLTVPATPPPAFEPTPTPTPTPVPKPGQKKKSRPALRRDALWFAGMPAYLLGAVTDRQLREAERGPLRSELDPQMGTLPARDGWAVVDRECLGLVGVNAAAPGVVLGGVSGNATVTGGRTRGEGKAKRPGAIAQAGGSVGGGSRRRPGVARRKGAREADAEPPKRTEECAAPAEHLFRTGFSLSARAVGEVARRAAQQVREGRTLRSQWDAMFEKSKNGNAVGAQGGVAGGGVNGGGGGGGYPQGSAAQGWGQPNTGVGGGWEGVSGQAGMWS